MPVTISVAMATCNGERFVRDQFDSIVRQTRLPDEVVICDDCSTDRTVAIVEALAASAPFDVRVVRNRSRVGYSDNFIQAARLCRCDLVAFCDQDDVWRPDKLARCAEEFEADPRVVMVLHRGVLFGSGARQRRRMYPRFHRRRVAGPETLPLLYSSPGFAQVARRGLLEVWSPRDASLVDVLGEGWQSHDGWVSFWASALGKVVFLPDGLAWYRQHDANVGAPTVSLSNAALRTLGWAGAERKRLRATSRWALTRARVLEELETQIQSGRWAVASGGPTARAGLWRRLAVVSERRADVYDSSGLAMIGSLIRCVAFGDYGRRARGGSGLSSLGRDVLHATGVLHFTTRAARRWTGLPPLNDNPGSGSAK